uniref:RUN domain-containing protein n=1 Tax=Macrostomum lignano TaxID=282301 RepID=A0A1I8J2W8_9PLAT
MDNAVRDLLKDCLSSNNVKLKQLERLAGKLCFLGQINKLLHPFLRPLFDFMDGRDLRLPQEGRETCFNCGCRQWILTARLQSARSTSCSAGIRHCPESRIQLHAFHLPGHMKLNSESASRVFSPKHELASPAPDPTQDNTRLAFVFRGDRQLLSRQPHSTAAVPYVAQHIFSFCPATALCFHLPLWPLIAVCLPWWPPPDHRQV